MVVDSSSPEFEAPSVAALSTWLYSPLVENGRPVERRGVRRVMRYQLVLDPAWIEGEARLRQLREIEAERQRRAAEAGAR